MTDYPLIFFHFHPILYEFWKVIWPTYFTSLWKWINALWVKTRSFWDIENSLSHQRGSERSEQASKRVSEAEGPSVASSPEQGKERAVQANGRASGPVPQSGFLIFLAHSAKEHRPGNGMNDENKSNPLETQLTEMNNDPDYQYWTSTYTDLNETITMPSWSKKKFLKKIHFVIYDAARVGCLKKLPSFKVKKKTASTCFVAIFLIKMGSKPSCPLSEGEYGKVETALAKWGWDWRGMTSGGDNKIVKLTRKWMIRSLFWTGWVFFRGKKWNPPKNNIKMPTEKEEFFLIKI